MKRYLLGELDEAEQKALEEEYFTDSQVFDEMTEVESDLVDDYVRGRLPAETRKQFEQFYMAHAKRRERVKFAEALLTGLDHIEAPRAVAQKPVETVSGRRGLLESLRRLWLAPAFSLAIVSLLVVAIGILLFIEARRTRQELAEMQTARAGQEQRARELEQQVAGERERADQLAAELEQLRNQQPPETRPQPAPALASLLLTVGPGVRGADTGPQATLVIPPSAERVRIALRMKEHDYPSYHVSLQAAGGQEIFSRQNIKPGMTRSGTAFTISLPASKFSTGDYILTLRGTTAGGGVEDLSKSIFRVEKK
jgi:hypothetical protein